VASGKWLVTGVGLALELLAKLLELMLEDETAKTELLDLAEELDNAAELLDLAEELDDATVELELGRIAFNSETNCWSTNAGGFVLRL